MPICYAVRVTDIKTGEQLILKTFATHKEANEFVKFSKEAEKPNTGRYHIFSYKGELQ